jgi:superfamily II DNA or RNA helicase
MAARLSHAGISAAAISGETPTSARRYFLDRFQSGKIRVLCNHSVLTTGFDASETEMVFIARQVFSPIRYMQMVGRGLRGEQNGGTAQFRFPSSTVAVCA